jgi:hypothetical protein
MFIEAYTGIY